MGKNLGHLFVDVPKHKMNYFEVFSLFRLSKILLGLSQYLPELEAWYNARHLPVTRLLCIFSYIYNKLIQVLKVFRISIIKFKIIIKVEESRKTIRFGPFL